MKDNKLTVITSWDDVTHLDLKLNELLSDYKLKGSFYAIGDSVGKEISKEQLHHISEYHEIGAHTMRHPTLTTISYEHAREEIINSKKYLEKCIEKEITSFAYPKGKYNKDHVNIVKKAGFICARTVEPFFFNDAVHIYEMPVSLWASPHRLRDISSLSRLFKIFPNMAFNPFLIKNWKKLGKTIFDFLIERGGVFHLFGHAWQVEKINGWEKLESLFSYIAFRNDVNYFTLSDYAKTLLN